VENSVMLVDAKTFILRHLIELELPAIGWEMLMKGGGGRGR
jgi:hypothetical protein|tara:strand:+ start:765 stop:887 length:123 start_codon:yes stop_codon:yes gene_type:complete